MVTKDATPVKSDKPDEPKKKEAGDGEKVVELTDEDKKLKDDLEMIVQVLGEPNEKLYQPSLESMKTLIRASTTSMTSVPKPLKFMMPHYETMKSIHDKMPKGASKKLMAGIISALAMCSGEQGDCIKYRLLGADEAIDDWGHEYVRHLAMEVTEAWKNADDHDREVQLIPLVEAIIKYNMKHNAEVEACDLLTEIERLDLLLRAVEEPDHERVCLYLLSCAPFTPDPDNIAIISSAKDIYLKFEKPFEALRCALMLNDVISIREIFLECEDILVQKQMALLLGRHQVFLELLEDPKIYKGLTPEEEEQKKDQLRPMMELNSNSKLHHYFHSLGRELDIMEPKTPEGVYKAHLENTRPFGGSTTTDNNARMTLASSFVNGFVNCGFSVDKMMSDQESANRWFYKNRDYGILSAAASQGLIYRWDIDAGLTACDRFLYVNDDYVKAGTLLAIGIICSGIQDESDPAQALLLDNLESEKSSVRIGSVLGLGLAYANSKRNTVLTDEPGNVVHELRKTLFDTKPSATPEVKGLAGLSIGFILVGSADADVAGDMLQLLMEKSSIELADPNMRFLALGIALLFLGTQERSEVFVESLRCLPEPFGSMVATLTDVCAYAGTGNVLKIQRLLHICSEHYETKEDKKKDDKKAKPDEKGDKKDKEEKKDERPDLSAEQAVAVLGIGLISMGEDVGSQMSLRMFGHLIRYGEPVIRRAVPLALALISLSNPQLNILETLSKFSHDSDADTAHNAIFALGLVSAGTNNARTVAMLRQLASYHYKEPVSLMLVRLSQGLTHLGKGTLTLNPYHSDRQLMRPAAIAGILSVCFAFLDANNSVLNNRQHYLLYSLVLAMQPRFLITLLGDEADPTAEPTPVNVPVRVGQAVDIVAQAGRPKTITGFQTHTTPVVLAYGERAELANEEYIALTQHLEGLVILKKNPDYEAGKTTATPAKK